MAGVLRRSFGFSFSWVDGVRGWYICEHSSRREECDAFGRTYYNIHVDRLKRRHHTHLSHTACGGNWALKGLNSEYIHRVSVGLRLGVSMAVKAFEGSFADGAGALVA